MQANQKKIIGRMAARIFSLPVGRYLVSEQFSRFLRGHDLDDIWNESLGLSRDRSELYGDDVMKNAVGEFLYHIFFRRPDEFPALFRQFLSGVPEKIPQLLSAQLKKDLAELGYPAEDLAQEFSMLHTEDEERPGHARKNCPD